jgi:hypothetical protein
VSLGFNLGLNLGVGGSVSGNTKLYNPIDKNVRNKISSGRPDKVIEGLGQAALNTVIEANPLTHIGRALKFW